MGSTWADLQKAIDAGTEELCESEYRRGYADGWIQAIEAMHDLMFDRGLSRQAAYEAGFSHWQGPLVSWQRQGAGELVLPPAVKLEALEV